MVSQYKTNWEDYWSKLFEDRDTAFWDVPSDAALADSLLRMQNSFEPTLPTIDFGCGNGTQTFLLAEHSVAVIGVDVSAAAIKEAKGNNTSNNVFFDVLDGTSELEVQEFYSKVGDANIYMRGILDQISPDDRPAIFKSLQTLMGDRGQLYLSELSSKAKVLFQQLAQQSAPPPQLARIYQHGIEPANIDPEEIRANFSNDKYSIVDEGETSITTNYILQSGDRLQVPAFYMLIKAK